MSVHWARRTWLRERQAGAIDPEQTLDVWRIFGLDGRESYRELRLERLQARAGAVRDVVEKKRSALLTGIQSTTTPIASKPSRASDMCPSPYKRLPGAN